MLLDSVVGVFVTLRSSEVMEKKFFSYFRMSTESFDKLLNRLSPLLRKQVCGQEATEVVSRLSLPSWDGKWLLCLSIESHVHFTLFTTLSRAVFKRAPWWQQWSRMAYSCSQPWPWSVKAVIDTHSYLRARRRAVDGAQQKVDTSERGQEVPLIVQVTTMGVSPSSLFLSVTHCWVRLRLLDLLIFVIVYWLTI